MNKLFGNKSKYQDLNKIKEKNLKVKSKYLTKLSGGKLFNLQSNLENYRDFVNKHFLNNENRILKKSIINEINNLITKKKKSNNNDNINDNNEFFNQNRNNIFYIYEKDKIIVIGVIGEPEVYKDKKYLNILYLLSYEKRKKSGTKAIYNILLNLPEKYNGICLYSVTGALQFYKKLGFLNPPGKEYDFLILDKNIENIKNLEKILSNSNSKSNLLTTEFYSINKL